MYRNEDECLAAGLDPKEVDKIARGLSRYGKMAKDLGISVFGGSGSGSLRFNQMNGKPELIVADLVGGIFDGGDGATDYDSDGLRRGEM
ncbi:hypothetical protein KASHIRA_02850 [Serratia phage vB_SmaM-Kashira]|nr:hypothetical protein KASHIRA_02850 [Serratia phage vB_SmaM-Kashira]